jgi:hypothetical protein
MENLDEFINKLEKNLFEINSFYLSCIFKDICLQNYVYRPKSGMCNQIIHEWEHKYSSQIITVDIMRYILIDDIYNIIYEIQGKYLIESREYEPQHEILHRKIKKIAEICITLRKGLIFKEFIDCYRFGYFN